MEKPAVNADTSAMKHMQVLTIRIPPLAPLVALLAALLSVAGCATRTQVTGAWQGDQRTAAFSQVLVVGVTPNSRTRRSFELALAEALTSRGTTATAAVRAGGEAGESVSADAVRTLARSTGADAVLVTRLASRRVAAEESADRVGVKTRQPEKLDGGLGLKEFFSTEYQEYEVPGDLSAQSTAVIESSLYEARNGGRLVYTVTTTAEFDEDDDVVGDVAEAVAVELRKAGLVE